MNTSLQDIRETPGWMNQPMGGLAPIPRHGAQPDCVSLPSYVSTPNEKPRVHWAIPPEEALATLVSPLIGDEG